MFYFGQILLHHITQNKFKNFSRKITSNLYNVSKILRNVPQTRPIETVWSLLEQKVYEDTWEAKNLEQLSRRIILKTKQLDQDLVTRRGVHRAGQNLPCPVSCPVQDRTQDRFLEIHVALDRAGSKLGQDRSGQVGVHMPWRFCRAKVCVLR